MNESTGAKEHLHLGKGSTPVREARIVFERNMLTLENREFFTKLQQESSVLCRMCCTQVFVITSLFFSPRF